MRETCLLVVFNLCVCLDEIVMVVQGLVLRMPVDGNEPEKQTRMQSVVVFCISASFIHMQPYSDADYLGASGGSICGTALRCDCVGGPAVLQPGASMSNAAWGWDRG